MFLFWLAPEIFIGVCENIKDSCDAHKHHQDPEFRRRWGKYLDR